MLKARQKLYWPWRWTLPRYRRPFSLLSLGIRSITNHADVARTQLAKEGDDVAAQCWDMKDRFYMDCRVMNGLALAPQFADASGIRHPFDTDRTLAGRDLIWNFLNCIAALDLLQPQKLGRGILCTLVRLSPRRAFPALQVEFLTIQEFLYTLIHPFLRLLLLRSSRTRRNSPLRLLCLLLLVYLGTAIWRLDTTQRHSDNQSHSLR